MQIPAIRLDSLVLVGDNAHIPAAAVGWYFGSAFPGTNGNVVLFGHLDGPGGAPRVFAHLDQLRNGDEVRILTRDWVYVYVVDKIDVTKANAVEAMAPTGSPVVTLITCAGPWDPVAATYHERLVVRATLQHVEPA